MKHRHSKKRKAAAIVLIVLAILVAIRLVLPYVILHYTNRTLDTMEGYRGHIEDIDLAIIRGAYKIDSIYLHKVDSITKKEIPFLAASVVDLAIEWKALFKGSLVGKVVVEEPMIRFTKEKVEPDDVQKDSSDFRRVLNEFMPLNINRLEFKNGTLQYADHTSEPPVNVSMTEIHLVAYNLRNSYDSAAVLPATINAHAIVYDGRLDLKMKLNPLADVPTFDLNAEWKNTNLRKLNNFFQAYANIDVNKGTFGLYTEIAAKEGHFTGYVKPLIEGMDVVGKEDRKDNILQKLWESISATVTETFENPKKETFATKIPLNGEIEDPKASIWQAILQVLKNAFIRALQPAIDQEISLGAVDQEQEEKKGVLEKVFGGKGEDEKDKKKKDDKKEKD
jgi:hypothetical protein